MKLPHLSCCVFFGEELERMHRQEKKKNAKKNYFVIDERFF